MTEAKELLGAAVSDLEPVRLSTERIRRRARTRRARGRLAAGATAIVVAGATTAWLVVAFSTDRLETVTPFSPAPTASRNGAAPVGLGGEIAFVASREEPTPTTSTVAVPGEPSVRTEIYSVDPTGGPVEQMTNDGTTKGSLVWSPDGSMLAFTTYDESAEVERLELIRPDGSDRQVLCEACTGTFLVQDPDSICDDFCDLSPSPFTDRLTWSPDGRWIAAPGSTERSLALINATSGEFVRIPMGAVQGTSWSPDGSQVAVTVADRRGTEGLAIVDVPSGHVRFLVEGAPYYGVRPAWSPNGSTIAYARGARVGGDLHAELLFVDADGVGAKTVLGADELFEVYDLAWSPDGETLAVAYHPVHPPTAGLLTVDAAGRNVDVIAVCGRTNTYGSLCPPNGGSIAWSADGSTLLFANHDRSLSHEVLVVLGPDGNTATLTAGYELGCCVAWQTSVTPSR